jgi:RNase H-fold protein (predicted Holliday junction resolvase)
MKYLGIDFGSKKVGFAQSDDEAAKEVVPAVMETMAAVKASQGIDVTPIPAV